VLEIGRSAQHGRELASIFRTASRQSRIGIGRTAQLLCPTSRPPHERGRDHGTMRWLRRIAKNLTI